MEWRRYGFPPGYRFVPNDGELIGILSRKIAGRPLPVPASVFCDIDVLDCHPQEIYDKHKESMEDGYIYFFSERTFSNPNGNRERPTRATKHGTWKASGGAKVIVRNGVKVGRARTLVFHTYKVEEKGGRKRKRAVGRTGFAMQEFMIILPAGTSKVIADLALYRLYMKEGNKRRKERCVDPENGVATAEAAVYGQGQFFILGAPPQLEMAPAVESQPAVMQCYGGPWSSMVAPPYYSCPCAAPAAVDHPSLLPVIHQQPAGEGAYLDGVRYVGGHDDGFADVDVKPLLEMLPPAPSQELDQTGAAGACSEQFEQVKSPELVGHMYGGADMKAYAWSPEELWAVEHCGSGAGSENHASPDEQSEAEHCRVYMGSEGRASPDEPRLTEHCQIGTGFDNDGEDGGGNNFSLKVGTSFENDCKDGGDNSFTSTGFKNRSDDDGDSDFSGTQDFHEHGGEGGELSCWTELEF